MGLLANRSVLRLVEFLSPNFNPRMPVKQPTFRERIRLLEIASAEVTSISELFLGDQLHARLGEVAGIIDAEVARMERAAQRWEQKAPRANAKTGA